MPDMTLEQIPEIKRPRRWPWVALAVVVIAALLVARWWMTRGAGCGTLCTDPSSDTPPPPPPEPVAAEVVPAPAPAIRVEPATEPPAPAAVTPPVMPAATPAPAAPAPAAALPAAVEAALGQADAMERDGALQEARALCDELYASTNATEAVRRELEGRLSRLNPALVLSPMKMPEKKLHVVKPGESLQLIAKKYGTTVELLQRSNQIMNPNRIKAGDMLNVFTGAFRIEVSKSRNELLVLLNDRFFKRYTVATGKYGKTPVGSFEVRDKTSQPTWWRPDGKEVPYGDPENILGTRWMSIRATGTTEDVRGYGIHGTWDETSIGSAASAGCVRMRNADVEELFDMIPSGTTVVITE